MKIAILGANGFLGKCILTYIRNLELIPVTRKDVDLSNFLEVKNWLIKTRPDIVINCAVSGGTKSGLNSQIVDDIRNNISIFLNFYNNSNYFFKFINIGSGAEFDLTTNIDNITEEKILTSIPKDSYGYSKNLISRLILEKDNFYTLRLFGCFDESEPSYRLFKKLLSEKINIEDRKFDYISVRDFIEILKFYIYNNNLIKDVNCVYQNKYLLSEILHKFNKEFNNVGINPLNYTGNGNKLDTLGIKLKGLDSGIKEYINGVKYGSL